MSSVWNVAVRVHSAVDRRLYFGADIRDWGYPLWSGTINFGVQQAVTNYTPFDFFGSGQGSWFWAPPPVSGRGHPLRISGTLYDSAGAIVVGATVDVFLTATDVLVGTTTSDGNGYYAVWVHDPDTTGAPTYYAVAYKAGATDKAGVSKNTLVGV